MAAHTRGQGEPRRRAARFFAAHRRPAGGARAGHHHRRGVPVFLDAAAQVHHRRHAGPRAVHAQHGHRRFHGGAGCDPGRRAQRRAAAIAAARLHRQPAGHPSPGRGREQDGPRRLRRTSLPADRDGLSGLSRPVRFRSRPDFIPISALLGDNVVRPSHRMPWFTGQSLFDYLESVPVGLRSLQPGFRFPVQRVVRPNLDFRGYAGQIASAPSRPETGWLPCLPAARRV